MNEQEKIKQFIEEHCSKCKNKDTYKCHIVITENGKVRCTEEEPIE